MVPSQRNSRPVTLLRNLVRTNQRLRLRDTLLCESMGLQPSEFDVIATLGNTDGMRMCDLATKTLMSPPNITRVVKKLEERGLVSRMRSKTSDREVVAALTSEGTATFERTYPHMVQQLRDDFDGRLTLDEQDALIALLSRLMDDDGAE